MPCDRRVRALALFSSLSLLSSLVAACADEDGGLGKAPDEFTRGSTNLGMPERPDAEVDAAEPTTFFTDGGQGPCCDVKFSFKATSEGETVVYVRGDALRDVDEVLKLKKMSGVWQGTFCLPEGLSGTYYYDLGFAAELEDGGVDEDVKGLFFSSRYNPDQSTTEDPLLGTVNMLEAKTCK